MSVPSLTKLMREAELRKVNYSVRLEWSAGKWYEISKLIKVQPEDREKAYASIDWSMSGPYGTDGHSYGCFETLCEALKKSPCSPFELMYCGDFTEEEIIELHTTIIEMYEAGDLDCYNIPDIETRIKNFVLDFNKGIYTQGNPAVGSDDSPSSADATGFFK